MLRNTVKLTKKIIINTAIIAFVFQLLSQAEKHSYGK